MSTETESEIRLRKIRLVRELLDRALYADAMAELAGALTGDEWEAFIERHGLVECQ